MNYRYPLFLLTQKAQKKQLGKKKTPKGDSLVATSDRLFAGGTRQTFL
jgi:hypothetical protein